MNHSVPRHLFGFLYHHRPHHQCAYTHSYIIYLCDHFGKPLSDIIMAFCTVLWSLIHNNHQHHNNRFFLSLADSTASTTSRKIMFNMTREETTVSERKKGVVDMSKNGVEQTAHISIQNEKNIYLEQRMWMIEQKKKQRAESMVVTLFGSTYIMASHC